MLKSELSSNLKPLDTKTSYFFQDSQRALITTFRYKEVNSKMSETRKAATLEYALGHSSVS